MGLLAGENKVFGRGLLKSNCPEFIKKELSFVKLDYIGAANENKNSRDISVDISLLSKRAQFYLRLMEICVEDNCTTIQQNALALSSFIEEFCESYKDQIGFGCRIILGKALILEALSKLEPMTEFKNKILEIELRAQMDTLKNIIVNVLI